MLLAAAIRGLIAFDGPLWRDEALFITIVRTGSFRDLVRVLHFHESHPPLFYVMMRSWLWLTGDSDSRALLLPIVLGVALVPVMFVAGRQLYSRRAGFVAAAFTAIVPALNEYSGELRPYSLLPLLVMLSCWALVAALKRRSLLLWSAYAAATIALVYTHNWAWLIVAGQLAATAIAIFREWNNQGIRLALSSGLSFGAVGLAYLPWLPSLIFQAAHAGHPPRDVGNATALLMLIPNGIGRAVQSTLLPPVHALQVLAVVACAAFVLSIVILVWRISRSRQSIAGKGAPPNAPPPASVPHANTTLATTVFLTVPVVATLAATVSSIHSDMMQPRCLAMLTPLLIMLVADGVDRTWSGSAPTSMRRRLVLAGASVLILDYSVRLEFLIRTPRSNAKAVATAVAKATQPSDLVIVAREWIAASFNHYYPASNRQIDFPLFRRQDSGDFSDVWSRLADPAALERVASEIAAAKKSRRRVWLIVDGPALKPLSVDESRDADKPGHYISMSSVRAKEIQKMLIREYGQPDEVRSAGAEPSRYENLHAFLFYSR
jgi:4-amino-4-deoxy-L-arabinose transferase-like glycosyltransferase